jgi:hypothetical protein
VIASDEAEAEPDDARAVERAEDDAAGLRAGDQLVRRDHVDVLVPPRAALDLLARVVLGDGGDRADGRGLGHGKRRIVI